MKEKKRLLIYYPPNNRAIGLNAVIDLLNDLDVEIFVLTQTPWGELHNDIEKKLLPGHCAGSENKQVRGISFYYYHTKQLIRFCKKNKINIVFSHLQAGNLVSIMASMFLRSTRFIFFRHHFHYFKKFKADYLKVGKNELFGEKIINRFAKTIVVPSSTVKQGMIEYEAVSPSKIRLIPYVYNFNEYPEVNFTNVSKIKSDYKTHLLLLMCSRFVEPKRHRLVLSVMKNLVIGKQLDIKLLLLDEGHLKEEMKKLVVEKGLEKNVFFVGYTRNVLDYMAASDLLVHPSLAEASNSSVKEMGLAGRTAVVCSGVGDFDDYITNNEDGFLIDPNNSGQELEAAIEFAYHNTDKLNKMGAALKKKVVSKFSPNDEIRNQYKSLLN